MCLALYAATSSEIPVEQSPDLSVEAIKPAEAPVAQWFSLPHVRFIGGHTQCSCAFPSVVAEQPVEYFEGMALGQPDSREADLRSIRRLLSLLQSLLDDGATVELLPVWNGQEAVPPKGAIELSLRDVDPDTFFFNEQFLYRVR